MEGVLFCDGACSRNGRKDAEASYGGVLLNLKLDRVVNPLLKEYNGIVVYHSVKTNNIAEYHSLIEGLKIAINQDIKKIIIKMDSKLVVE